MKLSAVIAGFASDLADNQPGNEYATWSKDELLSWWNEARCVVASLRPDKYTCTKTLKLCTGSLQNFCECDSIVQVFGQSDAYGNLLRPLAKNSFLISSRWNRRRVCAEDDSSYGAEDFTLNGYSVANSGDGTLLVNPAVPPGVDAYIAVQCRVSPTTMSDLNADLNDMDCALVAVAKQWVLGRAYQNYDGPQAMQHSQAAFTMFFRLLNLQFNMDLIAKSGATPTSVTLK